MEDFQLGPWCVCPDTNRLRATDGRVVHLEPRVMQVLTYLAARPTQVIKRDDLLQAVWGPNSYDFVLTQAISALRKALDDDRRKPQYVETIPKRGYRLVTVPSSTTTVVDSPPPQLTTHRNAWIGAAMLALFTAIAALAPDREGARTDPSVKLAAVPLTSLPGAELHPSLSPDGDRVAFVWKSPSETRYGLFVKDVGADQPTRLSRAGVSAGAPAWSFSGDRIAYAQTGNTGCEIQILDVAGAVSTESIPCHPQGEPTLAWNPLGEALAISDRDGPGRPYRISLRELGSGHHEWLTNPTGIVSLGDRYPAFSPDGRLLAFVRMEDGDVGTLHTLDLESGRLQKVSRHRSRVFGLGWSGDGRWIVFSSNRTGTTRLWAIAPRGGEPVPLSGPVAAYPSVASRHPSIAYAEVEGNADILRLDLLEPNTLAEIESTRWDSDPEISPAGDRIVFLSTRSGFPALWLTDLTGTATHRLTQQIDAVPGHPRWSPDGTRIAFDVRDGDHSVIYLIAAQGGVPQWATDGESPTWSRDGSSLYFSAINHGARALWKIDLATGRRHRLIDEGLVGSETDMGLLVARSDRCGLWLMDPVTGDVKGKIDALACRDALNWRAIGDEVFLIARNFNDDAVLIRHDLRSAIETRVRSIGSGLLDGMSLAVSPDRSWALVATLGDKESDIMLATLPPIH